MLRGGSLEEGERPLDIRRGTPFGNPYLVTRGIGRAAGAYAALREADDGGDRRRGLLDAFSTAAAAAVEALWGLVG